MNYSKKQIADIYFDNAATSPVSSAAIQAAVQIMESEYGNPSSVHAKGAEALHNLNQARGQLAELLNKKPQELIFTSCGTESNNLALLGAAQMNERFGRRILIPATEHASVLEPAKHLVNSGWQLDYIPLEKNGQVDLDQLEQLLTAETSIVSVMHVNNETGVVQPLREIGRLVRQKAPQAFFHVDGVQSFARLLVDLAAWQADSFTASGHKIHAPKGISLLWCRKANLPPLLHGGGQENGLRSGTENLPAIMAFAAAANEASSHMAENAEHMRRVKAALLDMLQTKLPDIKINGPEPTSEQAAPHIVNVSFPGYRSETLLHHLESMGLYVSAGSACNSRSSKGSYVLQAMGLSHECVDSALRFSFSRNNTVDEAEAAAEIIIAAVEELRMFSGKSKRR